MKTLGELTEITVKPESTRRHSRKIVVPETPAVNKVRGSRRNKNWHETLHHDLVEPEKGGLTIKLFHMGPVKEELKPLLDIQNRTDDQALAIYHLLWDSKFFTEISSGNGDVINLSGMAHLCKKFKYVTYPSGSVIVNQDEPFSSKVYLILSGCVSIMNKYSTTLQSNEKVHHSRPSIFVNGDSPVGRLSARAQRPSFAIPRRRVSAFSPFSPTNLFEGLKSRKSFRKIMDVSSEDVSRDSSSFGEEDEKTRLFDSGTRPSITEPVEKLIERLLEGDYFGAKCSFKRTHRKLGATASTNVEMLVLDKEDLEYAKNEFNNQKVEILKFLMETFPYFYNEEQKGAYEEILHSADIKLLNYQRKVINEGEPGDEFYAIVDGECDLIKTVIYEKEDNLMQDVKSLYGLNKSAKEEIRISCLQKGTLFGEEILFNDKCPYEYSVRVTSVKARLLAFKKSEFIRRCPADKLEQLKQMFAEKNNRNSRSVHEKLSKKGIQTDSEALKTPKPTIKIPKFRGSYDGTYQNLSPKKSGARSPIGFTDETDYIVPSTFHLQSTALELDSPVGDPPKDNHGYYIPIPNKPAGAQGIVRPLTKQFHSFVSHKMAFSAMNSPLQSKDHSTERKPQGNTSFQGVKDIIMNVTGGLTRSQGFKATTRPPTEIADIEGVRFDFGRTKKPSRIFKSRQESYDGQSSPCFHRNVGLAGLITLKMKEMEQTGEAFRTAKPGKDHMSISERSAGLIKGTNIKHLKMLETSPKLQIEDYRLASSPFESGSSPKEVNKTTKKGFMKSKIKINKIASHSSTIPRNSELLPNIQVNKFSPNIGGIKARDTRTSKFFMG